ncbi:DUF1150 domain-containing protein [Stappia sp. WLB 29]|uniref:BQ00720 family protein n=1 Tax=Stappia sp. WLB 29 TaxID=2925220 RepID=UPI0020C0F652|nr:DUF1150 domain-containing protein [Stappia sp. WLB 29]
MTCDEQTFTMKPGEFQALGTGQIAYVKPMTSDDLTTLFPQAPRMRPGLNLWVLLNADGTPIMLSDSRETALANAAEHQLHTVALH